MPIQTIGYLVLLTSVAFASYSPSQQCFQTFDDGWRVNLTSLQRKDPWVVGQNPQIYFSVCDDVEKPTVCADKPSASAYAVVDSNRCFALGSAESSRWFINQRSSEDLNLVYLNGEPCDGLGSVTRSFRLALKCDPIGESNGRFGGMFQEPDGCTLTVWWETPAACGYKVSTLTLCVNDIRKLCPTVGADDDEESVGKCLNRNLNSLSDKCASAVPPNLLPCLPNAVTHCGSHGGGGTIDCLAQNMRFLRRKCRRRLKEMMKQVGNGEFEEVIEEELPEWEEEDEAQIQSDFESEAGHRRGLTTEETVGLVVIGSGLSFLVALAVCLLRRCARCCHKGKISSRKAKYSRVNVHEDDIPEGIALDEEIAAGIVTGIPLHDGPFARTSSSSAAQAS